MCAKLDQHDLKIEILRSLQAASALHAAAADGELGGAKVDPVWVLNAEW